MFSNYTGIKLEIKRYLENFIYKLSNILLNNLFNLSKMNTYVHQQNVWMCKEALLIISPNRK